MNPENWFFRKFGATFKSQTDSCVKMPRIQWSSRALLAPENGFRAREGYRQLIIKRKHRVIYDFGFSFNLSKNCCRISSQF